jgi:hypothetical protein
MSMNKQVLAGLALGALALVAGPGAQAQSIYSNAVAGLNPVGYWPLNETTPPPQPLNITALNLGSLGAAGNGYYGAWYQPSGNQWYLTNNIVQAPAVTAPFDGSVGMLCQEAPGQYVIIPRNTNGVANTSLALNPPFSIEAWLQIGATNSVLSDVVSQGGFVNLNTGGPNTNNPFYGGFGTNAWAGVELGQYQDYIFFECQATNGQSKANEIDSTAYNAWKGFKPGQWVHVVATFDGSKEILWTNGVIAVSKTVGANSAGVKYVVDPTSPLMIASGSEVTSSYGQAYHGTIDDVAIYDSVLLQTSIQNHYQTAYGTNATYGSVYTNAVLADSPVLYFRLNDPQTQTNAGYPSGTFPVANNYGSLGAAANGVYQPGTTPGVAGPAYAGFGSNSKAVAFNGWFGGVDVGSSNIPAALNPIGIVPMTVVSWFQTGPADAPGRFQEILGHSDSSYRLSLGQNDLNGGGGDMHFNPGPGPELQFTNSVSMITNGFALNDGNWHMIAGVSDGTNDYLYLDGVLAQTNRNATGINIVGTTRDLLIGGDPQYTYAGTTNAVNTIRTFDGQVAQVAFWTNALSPAQIQSLFSAAAVPPYIYGQPLASLSVNAGTNVNVLVGLRGSQPVTYQWYQNGVPVASQTNSALNYSPVGTSNAGSYVLVATDSAGSVTSSVVNLVVYGPPTILQQTPAQLNIFAGSSPVLQVSALGAVPIHYQWSLNSSPLAGATNSSYTLTNLQSSGTYTCVLTNFVGTTPITPIAVTVQADPTAPFPARVLADGPVAYFRLDESSGTTAYDYVGGNNATYTNVSLGEPGYDSTASVKSDPTETAAGFGNNNPPNNFAGNGPTYLNFGTPNGSNAEFSVEAWVQQYLYAGGGDCIVGLGYGGGGEQFVLDTGAANGDLRFFVRNAAGNSYGASSTINIADSTWHHVVGVCDEVNGHVYIYLDGNQVGSTTIPAGSGLLSSSTPLSIGARQSANNGGTNYDYQLYGNVDDVAIYNKALSASQVLSNHLASGVAPLITGLTPSSNWTTNQAANVVFTVAATGTAPLSYQWSDIYGNPIPWGTNATLILTNVLSSQAGSYQVAVTNYYGGPVTTNVNLSVTTTPELLSDITPSNVTVYASVPVTLSVSVVGTPPLSYQWYQNSIAVPNATNTTYTFAALLGTSTYYVSVTNIYSAGSPLVSSTATVVGMPATTLSTNNYTDSMKITFSGYNRSETLSDFPVLVRLSPGLPGFRYNHFADPSGGDLRFTDSGGTRVIPSEIDQWNTNGESDVWVQVPALSGTNTSIWAYWGNPSATTALPGTNVWVPQPWEGLPAYDVVYHLKESGFPFLDSAGQFTATAGAAPSPVAGIVGTGELFANSVLDAGTINVGNYFTLSAWVNVAPTANNIQGIWASKAGGNTTGFALYVNFYQTSDQDLILETGNGSSTPTLRSPDGSVSSNQWHYVTAAVDRADSIANLYVDGALAVSASSLSLVRNDFATNQSVQLGEFIGGSLPYTGVIDEARIQSGTNSANWVWASYMTVQQNSSLENYSAIASTAPAEPVAINATFTAGNLTLSGSGGNPNATYYVVGSTNLTVPYGLWPVIVTTNFDSYGNFSVNVPISRTTPALYLRIKE